MYPSHKEYTSHKEILKALTDDTLKEAISLLLQRAILWLIQKESIRDEKERKELVKKLRFFDSEYSDLMLFRTLCELQSHSTSPDERISAAKRCTFPLTQKRLVDDENVLVVITLAKNPALIPLLQEELENHNDLRVQEALASNIKLCEKIQIRFAESGSIDVRETLARNPSICVIAQFILVKDKISSVRELMAKNHHLTDSFRLILMEDPVEAVKLIAEKLNLSNSEQLRITGYFKDDLLQRLTEAGVRSD